MIHDRLDVCFHAVKYLTTVNWRSHWTETKNVFPK